VVEGWRLIDEAYPLPDMNDELKGVIYFEKSKLPIKIWVFIAGMSASIYLAIWAPLGQVPALLITLIFTFGFLVLLQRMQTTIYITKDFLYANKAKIEIKYIKEVTPLTKAEFKELNGVAADPAAFLATNFWTHTAVKVVIKDKNDPTPYWLISTNRAGEVAKKLN
jgi:branched-subunit amino acid ABC-type transport system permease component